MAEPDAPALLTRELGKPRYKCAPLAMGTNADPYHPIERNWKITRGILEVLAATNHPVGIVRENWH